MRGGCGSIRSQLRSDATQVVELDICTYQIMNDEPVVGDESLLQTEKELQESAGRNDTAMIRQLMCLKVNVNAKSKVSARNSLQDSALNNIPLEQRL
ncbi:hypothetical protein chiPu_0026808 [Chiloscyllium punctatum]|uniref:Uncharacterized protein n=1 Tax=Chiloscyllium punctatum TaxID=137246 RepID=A0A401TIN8_CHIPU|nr:hypothetical protein [Chiloscyllium punctatum]